MLNIRNGNRSRFGLLGLAALALCSAAPAAAQSRGTVLTTGSSTVYPFTSAVAGAVGPRLSAAPEIRRTGTVHGFNEFCRGTSLRHPDIQSASRRMTPGEFLFCNRQGVNEILELPIGHDGIIAAHRRDLPQPNITLAQFWLAVAKEVPRDGRLVPNPHRRWRDISADLPDWPIRVIGPPPTSGTRDSFTDMVMLTGCQRVPELRTATETAQRQRVCTTVREDGAWVDGGEDDEVIVRRILDEAAGTIGVFGYSFLAGHRDAIAAARIEGVAPTIEAIASGRYPVARPLFVYAKRPNLRTVPGLAEFLAEFVSDTAMGPGGYLVRQGLVPLDAAQWRRIQDIVRNQVIMLRPPEG
ncbi:MAG: substrate-binding domain-containing protein [Roseomonas sp.]|nr:substrate-binding domain-containing protein [Roseomonas sp.]